MKSKERLSREQVVLYLHICIILTAIHEHYLKGNLAHDNYSNILPQFDLNIFNIKHHNCPN
jgi:hypothetical protein